MPITSIAGIIVTLVADTDADADAIMAVLAIRISSRKTPRYKQSNYD